MKTAIGIDDKKLEVVLGMITVLQADLMHLSLKSLQLSYSWQGISSLEGKKLLLSQAERLSFASKECMARAKDLGFSLLLSFKELSRNTRLSDAPLQIDASKILQHLLKDYEAICRLTRDEYKKLVEISDLGTAQVFETQLLLLERLSGEIRNCL